MSQVMITTKRCGKCGVQKPTSEFYAETKSPDGFQHRCKECATANQRQWAFDYPESSKGWKAVNPATVKIINKRSDRRRKYGLTQDDYDQMLEAQGGCCAICKTTKPGDNNQSFHIDHDHRCCAGKKSCGQCIRGLLCGSCNRALGLLKDSPEVLINAVKYLLGQSNTSFEILETYLNSEQQFRYVA